MKTSTTPVALAFVLTLLPAAVPAADTFETTDLGNSVYVDIFDDGRLASVGGNFALAGASFRIFQQDGTPACPLAELNSDPPASFNARPAVAVGGDGSVVAVWDQNSKIVARRFSSTGNPAGDPFVVSTRSDSENSPSVATNASGQFLVAWTYNLGGTRRARLRHYDADGTPVATPSSFLSPVNPSRLQLMLRDDRRANAVWGEYDRFADRSWVHAVHLREDGFRLGYLTVDHTAPGDGSHVYAPSAEADASGRFVVAWRRRDPGLNDRVLAREYDENARPLGPVRTLSDTAANAGDPQVAVDANGRAMVAWTSDADGQLHYTTLLIGRSNPTPPLPVTNGVPSINLTDLALNKSGHAAATYGAGLGVSNVITFQNGTSATVDHGPGFGAWQTRNFLEPDGPGAAPDGDPDHDRVPNLVEYKLGLPPRHSSPLPAPVPTGAQLQWVLPHNPAAAGVTLEVQYTTSLSAGAWTTVPVNISPDGSTASTSVPTVAGAPLFLRAVARQGE